MALIKCPECGKEISSESEKCVYCGFPIKPKSELKSFVVGKRGESHSMMVLVIFCLIIGILIATGAVFCFIGSVSEVDPGAQAALKIMGFFVGSLAALFLVLGIITLSRILSNRANSHDCIVYDAENNKLVLSTINGKKIIISPDQYISLKDNFFTDNLLYFTYRLKNGGLKKVNLGYCANRDDLRPNLRKILDAARK